MGYKKKCGRSWCKEENQCSECQEPEEGMRTRTWEYSIEVKHASGQAVSFYSMSLRHAGELAFMHSDAGDTVTVTDFLGKPVWLAVVVGGAQ